MVKTLLIAAIITLAFCCALLSDPAKEQSKSVGGELMLSSRDIGQNLEGSADHTTLATAWKAGGLTDILHEAGPFTVFAATNSAFSKLPRRTMEQLMSRPKDSALANMLKYSIVRGQLSSKELRRMLRSHHGVAVLKSLNGSPLLVTEDANGMLFIKDERDDLAKITVSDAYESNGILHVVDAVLLPRQGGK